MHIHVLTAETLNVVVEGRYFSCSRNSPVYDQVKAGVFDDQPVEYFDALLTPIETLKTAVGSLKLGNGAVVEVTHNSVLYNGAPVHPVLIAKVLDVIAEGFPADPWIEFVKNLYTNPDVASREEIYMFMEGAELPITEDGCIIAYKRVTAEYKDCHTGTFDNSIGQVVTVPRESVDKDRRNLCSRGLHFCSKSYLGHFVGARIVLVKVNPADIVSIPADHNNSKGRTWKYEVVGELSEEEVNKMRWPAVVANDSSDWDWADLDDDDDYGDNSDVIDDEDEDEDEDDDDDDDDDDTPDYDDWEPAVV